MATRITWQDTLLMPEDGMRYEAIDGDLCVTPAPTVRHQRISLKLGLALHRFLEQRDHVAAENAQPSRHDDLLPIRLRDLTLGEIALPEIFAEP